MAMSIEPLGIQRPPTLTEAGQGLRSARIAQAELRSQHEFAVQDAIARCEATGSKVVTDGEYAKESFAIYPSRSNEHCRRRNSDFSRGWQARVVSAHNIDGRSSNDSKLEIGR